MSLAVVGRLHPRHAINRTRGEHHLPARPARL